MTANTTHRKRLAKQLAAAATIPYQRAYNHVVACSEAGMLPDRLDQDGRDRALTVLRQQLAKPSGNPTREAATDGGAMRPATAPPRAAAVPLSKDPRCIQLAPVLADVMDRSCPKGAGGYGGSLQLNLLNTEVDALGGVDLFRAAMRKAGRQLGWKVQTLATRGDHLTTVVVIDNREAPQPYAAAVAADFQERSREAAERVSALLEGSLDELGPGPVDRQAAEFRAAAAHLLHGQRADRPQ